MSSNNELAEAKALDMMDKANKKMNSFSWPFGGGASTKFEEAGEMFANAGNNFKRAQKWQEAGDAFMKAAECAIKQQDSKHMVATRYVEAAGCYRKTNAQDAINCLRMAVDIHCDMGRFSIAAKHQKEIAELYESQEDLEEAINNYELAAQYYESENAVSGSNSCYLKVALFSAQLERYDKAIETYERVAAASIENSSLKWNVKSYYFNAGICHLCTGEVHTAKRALERYQDMDVTFSSTRECEMLEKLVTAMEESSVEDYTQAVVEFDRVSKLGPWHTTMLLRVKNALKADGDTLL